jgi:hypothetical protein
MEYALDPYRHPGRIMASRLLGFPCRRGLNPPSFGDRCDRIGNKTRDRSGCVVLRAISKETSAADYRKRYYHSIALLYGSNLAPAVFNGADLWRINFSERSQKDRDSLNSSCTS